MRKVVIFFDRESNSLWVTSSGRPRVTDVTAGSSNLVVRLGWSGCRIDVHLDRSGYMCAKIVESGIVVDPGSVIYYGGVFLSVTTDAQAMLQYTVCKIRRW